MRGEHARRDAAGQQTHTWVRLLAAAPLNCSLTAVHIWTGNVVGTLCKSPHTWASACQPAAATLAAMQHSLLIRSIPPCRLTASPTLATMPPPALPLDPWCVLYNSCETTAHGVQQVDSSRVLKC